MHYVLAGGELLARQLYWRLPHRVERALRRLRLRRRDRQVAERDKLREYLANIGVSAGARVMVHSSVGNLILQRARSDSCYSTRPLEAAVELLHILLDLLGSTGTLLMPTHPVYQGYNARVDVHLPEGCVPTYDPLRTPCSVGLLNELFRRTAGTLRSLYPLQTVACRGPYAAQFLDGNLHEGKPPPHGRESPYFRLAKAGGLVVSIGVPLHKHLTIVHVAEDLREGTWPVRDFYRERQFNVCANGTCRLWIVRERRPEFARCICEHILRCDLIKAGILHEGYVGTIRVDWARAEDVVHYVLDRNAHSTYPYFLTELAGPFR